jgi:hypothetical protein
MPIKTRLLSPGIYTLGGNQPILSVKEEARKELKAGNKRLQGRQDNTHRQTRKDTKKAYKKRLQGRQIRQDSQAGNTRLQGGRDKTPRQAKQDSKAGKTRLHVCSTLVKIRKILLTRYISFGLPRMEKVADSYHK